MILHELTVRGWRRFREEITLSFDDRLTIIHGPNESGKSTLIEALTRGLFDRHTVAGREMDSLRPWGSSLTPEVTVVFSAGGEKYRCRKRFLDSPSCELWTFIDGRWQLIADGDAADRRGIEFLGGQHPGRGLTKPRQRGVAEALWARQEDHEMPAGWNPGMMDRLEATLGEVLDSASSSAIERLISDRHLELLTEARGQPRTGGALHQALEELARKEADLDHVRQQRVDFERRMEDLSGIQGEIDTLRSQLGESEQELKEASEARDAAREHQEMRLNARTAHIEAERHWENLNRRVDGIRKARKMAEEARREMDGVAASLTPLRAELCSARGEVREIGLLLEERKRHHRQLQERMDALNALRALKTIDADIQRHRETATRAARVRGQIREAEQALEEEVFPSAETLEQAEELGEQIRDGEAVLKTQGLKIDIEPAAELGARVGLDGASWQPLTLEPGTPRSFAAANRADLEMPEIMKITVQSGNEVAAEAVARLKANRDDLSDLLASHDVASASELHEQYQRHQALNTQLEDLHQRLAEMPLEGDEADIERHLREQKNRRKRLQDELESASLPEDWLTHSPEVLDELLDEHAEERAQVQKHCQELEERQEAAEAPTPQLEGEISGLQQRLSVLRQQIEDRLAEAEDLEAEDEFTTAEARSRALQEAALAAERTRQAWEVLDAEKRDKEDEPERQYGAASRRLEQLRERISELQRAESGHLEVLEAGSASNVREREGDLEAEVEATRARVERLSRDAEAYRLAHKLLEAHRAERMRSLGGPVKTQVDRWMARLLGPGYAGVEFSSELTPNQVRVGHPDVVASVEADLSYGAREQLHFLVRLALGVILSEGERQVVILDDRLTNTDRGRLGRARAILEEAADRVQIVLLTCFPDGYSGIDGQFVDMRTLM